jgi:hypothetical protein
MNDATQPAPTPPPGRCGDCRFWTAPKAGNLGACRRFPAAERKEAGDWCGEFAAAATAGGAAGSAGGSTRRGRGRPRS